MFRVVIALNPYQYLTVNLFRRTVFFLEPPKVAPHLYNVQVALQLNHVLDTCNLPVNYRAQLT
jgi:hypothetical protein